MLTLEKSNINNFLLNINFLNVKTIDLMINTYYNIKYLNVKILNIETSLDL